MLNMLKSINPEKEYPSNLGKSWTKEEEYQLLEELESNIDINIIAQNHNRTTGGIYARCQIIAYELYTNNIPIEEIMEKTKLNYESIQLIIKKKTKKQKEKSPKTTESITCKNTTLEIKMDTSEMEEMKNEIKELKNTVKELVDMLKAIYVFEDA